MVLLGNPTYGGMRKKNMQENGRQRWKDDTDAAR